VIAGERLEHEQAISGERRAQPRKDRACEEVDVDDHVVGLAREPGERHVGGDRRDGTAGSSQLVDGRLVDVDRVDLEAQLGQEVRVAAAPACHVERSAAALAGYEAAVVDQPRGGRLSGG